MLVLNCESLIVGFFVFILANLHSIALLQRMLSGQSTHDDDPNYPRSGADVATVGVHGGETAEEGG